MIRRFIAFLFALVSLPFFFIAVYIGTKRDTGKIAFWCGRFVGTLLRWRYQMAGPFPSDLGYENPDDWENG